MKVFPFEYGCQRRIEALDFSGFGVTVFCGPLDFGDANKNHDLGQSSQHS